MPRKPKTTEPDAMPAEAAFAQEAPRGSKTAAIRAALKAHPKKLPKEIAELLNAEGWDVKPQSISVVKSAMKAKKRAKKAAEAPAPEAAGPVVPKDAVSVGLLVKAKKLVQELGGVKEAKVALNALAQLMD
jgi:ParB-like chromosome segregation protein Spo0J